jgi:hypothetical protein
MVENYEIDVGFVLWQIPSKYIISRPLFSERRVIISSSESNFSNKIHPKDLDPSKEISLYGGPSFQLWHDNLWNNSKQESLSVDTVAMLSSLIDVVDFWSIVPISIAKKLGNSKPIIISEIADPPPERVSYQITNKHPSPNKLKSLEIFENSLENFFNSDFFISVID